MKSVLDGFTTAVRKVPGSALPGRGQQVGDRQEFPAKQGKYREFLRHAGKNRPRMLRNPLIIQPFQHEFPMQRNREFFRLEQGILTR